jgi:hypothetical protein
MESTRIQAIAPASVPASSSNPAGRTWTHDPIPVGTPVVHVGIDLDLTLVAAATPATAGIVVTVRGRLGGFWYRLADVSIESIPFVTDTLRVQRSMAWASDACWANEVQAEVRVVGTATTAVTGRLRCTALGGSPCGA